MTITTKQNTEQENVDSFVHRHLRQLVQRNRAGEPVGTYAVCSAHPAVIQAAIRQAIEDGSVLHVESTSAQVNQFGGYTGVAPEQFATSLRETATRLGLPAEQVLIGADHLGPFPWRKETSAVAMAKACELARAAVRAGYQKIHLDASMACADDGGAVAEGVIAQRAAALAEAAEDETTKSRQAHLLYVIGTEVPPPGGEVAEGAAPVPTRIEDVQRTIEVFRKAFLDRGLNEMWENVVAVVVQPGVEFGDTKVFDYDRERAATLRNLPKDSALVYEAHSTDYQSQKALAELVEDHFAILKVGPWLTFAYREAIFALEMLEREILGAKRSIQLSRVREILDAEMVRDPVYWSSYYKGNDEQVKQARSYSFSDRCRYYWPRSSVQAEVARLLANLSKIVVPATLLSQYLPLEYEAVRTGSIGSSCEAIIEHHIRAVLRQYASACGVRSHGSHASA